VPNTPLPATSTFAPTRTDFPSAIALCQHKIIQIVNTNMISFIFLTRSAKLPTGLYILLALISFSLTREKLSQDLLDRFPRSRHQMKGNWVNFLDLDLFFDSFRDVALATDYGQNLRNYLYSTCWHFATDLNIAILIYR